jgi:hypothetical protein
MPKLALIAITLLFLVIPLSATYANLYIATSEFHALWRVSVNGTHCGNSLSEDGIYAHNGFFEVSSHGMADFAGGLLGDLVAPVRVRYDPVGPSSPFSAGQWTNQSDYRQTGNYSPLLFFKPEEHDCYLWVRLNPNDEAGAVNFVDYIFHPPENASMRFYFPTSRTVVGTINSANYVSPPSGYNRELVIEEHLAGNPPASVLMRVPLVTNVTRRTEFGFEWFTLLPPPYNRADSRIWYRERNQSQATGYIPSFMTEGGSIAHGYAPAAPWFDETFSMSSLGNNDSPLLPDLAVSALVVPTTMRPGWNYTILVNVSNIGNYTSLESATTLAIGNIETAQGGAPALAPGETVSYNPYTFYYSPDLPSMNIPITATADYYDMNFELNEMNNVRTKVAHRYFESQIDSAQAGGESYAPATSGSRWRLTKVWSAPIEPASPTNVEEKSKVPSPVKSEVETVVSSPVKPAVETTVPIPAKEKTDTKSPAPTIAGAMGIDAMDEFFSNIWTFLLHPA